MLDLFSGIGGFSYAAENIVGGFETVAFCEANVYCQKVIKNHWPSVPIFEDIRSLTLDEIKALYTDKISLITAGFPCQDLSKAGKLAGYNGSKSSLFYEIIRLAGEIRPDFLLLENVKNLLSHENGRTFQETLFQIARSGYDAEWAVISAEDMGACHKRERVWIVAYSKSLFSNGGANKHEKQSQDIQGSKFRDSDSQDFLPNSKSEPRGWDTWQNELQRAGDERNTGRYNARLSEKWKTYVSKPVLCRGDDGLSGGLDKNQQKFDFNDRLNRLKQLGNSVVPQVAAIPLQRIRKIADLAENEQGCC